MRKILILGLFTCLLTLVAPASSASADDDGPAATAVETAPTVEDGPSVKLPAPVPGDDELNSLLVNTVKSVQEGNWKLAISGVLFLLMFVLRAIKLPILQGDRGGAISVMVFALLGAFGTALASGAPITLGLITGAVTIAFTAVGGFTWVKRVWKPRDKNAPVA